jgi:hypothetical protein
MTKIWGHRLLDHKNRNRLFFHFTRIVILSIDDGLVVGYKRRAVATLREIFTLPVAKPHFSSARMVKVKRRL